MNRGIAFALLAAILFGASTPLAKALLAAVPPLMLAGLLYAGSGLGVLVILVLRRASMPRGFRLSLPRPGEWRWLAAAIALGGVAGPVALIYGLAGTPASTASLLLNLEAVFTALLAWLLFHENYGRRVGFGMALIVGGGVILAWMPGQSTQASPSAALIALACFFWAMDNNLTRKVAGSDALVIASMKGWVAGAVNIGLALWLGDTFPPLRIVAGAGAVGFLGYGISLVLFVLALRHLGSARAGAYFSVAAFFGAAVAVGLQGEALSLQLVLAGALMGIGVWLHLTERHDHLHTHEAQLHSHSHVHDEHHHHEHDSWDGREPHTHVHAHEPLVHAHPHYPDIHHRHPH